MNDESDRKGPTLTEHPLTKGQTAFTEEDIDITESLIRAGTTRDQQGATASNEAATLLTGEEEKRIEEEVEAEKIRAAIKEQVREDERSQSSNFTLRKVLGGDILSARLLRNNIWLVVTAVIFAVVYISNRYSVQKCLIEIDKLQKGLEDAKYRTLSNSSQLTEKTRKSHILEILRVKKDNVLKMSDRPPYIIDVPGKQGISRFDNDKATPRYSAIVIIMSLIAAAVIGKTIYTMTAGRAYQLEVAASQRKDNVTIKPTRGNISSCNGQLTASSLPGFKVYMNFNALKAAGSDTAFVDSINYVSKGLDNIFLERSAAYFKKYPVEGHCKESKYWAIWNERIDYNTLKEIQNLPIFHLSKYKNRFHWDEFNARRRPFGSLAQHTIGDMFGAKDTVRCGLELSYDSILRGTNGIIHRRKVRNKFLDITDTPPIGDADIITIADVSMRGLAGCTLLDELKDPNVNGNIGAATVMGVATGNVRAIVSLDKCSDGEYREAKNHVVDGLLEPGSVFKAASIMTILDDGFVDTMYTVQAEPDVWDVYGRDMKDHSWTRGGYGMLTLPRTLKYSSNIGVSRIVDMHYRKNPEKFVQGIYDLGLATNFHIPIVGYSPVRIRMPHKNSHGRYDSWGAAALPWTNIGYETQIPPISTLTFYNAVANGDKLVQPRFAKQIVKNDEVIYDNPPKILKEHTAKESTVKSVTRVLTEVVSEGLGKKAGSDKFLVASKTGTVQMSKGALGYKTGGTNYLLSFVDFFPTGKPRYSCIVYIQKTGLPASGGDMSGVVFHHIAEGVTAQSLKLNVADAHDASPVTIPTAKTGNLLTTDYVLNSLGFQVMNGQNGAYPFGDPIWEVTAIRRKSLTFRKEQAPKASIVPDIHGMGAHDAVYLMEKHGIKVMLTGRGRVIKQSVAPGRKIKKDMECELRME